MHDSANPPIGPLVNSDPAKPPHRAILEGHFACLEPLDPGRHGAALYRNSRSGDPDGRVWTYLAYGPFETEAVFLDWLTEQAASADPYFVAIIDKASGEAHGMASFMRITPQMRVIEIGHIWFAPSIQRSRIASEAIYLMMRETFALGYRRLEWKCDNLNAASRRAAQRFGFTYEGVFRQHMIVKGRSRDTAWYSLLDQEWPQIDAGFKAWLDEENFDSEGRQIHRLAELVADAQS